MAKRARLDHEVRQSLEAFIEKHFSPINVSGDEWNLNCPEPSCPSYGTGKLKLYYNVKFGVGFCFRCSSPFSMIDLVRTVSGMRWKEAKELVDGWRGVHIKPGGLLDRVRELQAGKVEEGELPPQVELPDEFIPCDEKHFPSYVASRMTLKSARRYRVGYCRSGQYQGRVIVPVYMPDGLRTFVARIMVKTPSNPRTRKVLGPQGAKNSLVLFNYQALRKHKSVVLVEGVFDAIYGGPAFMALLGTHISSYQIGLLRDSDVEDVVILFDADAKYKAFKVANLLKRALHRVRVRVNYLRKDPDEYDRGALEELVLRAKEPSLSDLLFAKSA